MRGHDELVKHRMNGYAPDLVTVVLDIGKPLRSESSRGVTLDDFIQIETDDRLSSLDLRGLCGLTVAVSGTDAARVRAFAAACQSVGASRVIATTSRLLKTARYEVSEVTDTAGVLVWRSEIGN